MSGSMARRVQNFQPPRPFIRRTWSKIKQVPVAKKSIDWNAPLEPIRRARMSPDRRMVAFGAGPGGADVVRMMMRQYHGAQAMAKRFVHRVKEAMLFLCIISAGIDEVARSATDEVGIGVGTRRQSRRLEWQALHIGSEEKGMHPPANQLCKERPEHGRRFVDRAIAQRLQRHRAWGRQQRLPAPPAARKLADLDPLAMLELA